MRRKASAVPPAVQAIAWAAQKRLCMRYRHLYHAGKKLCVVITAVGARAGGVPLGHCLRGDGPAPCDAGSELSDGLAVLHPLPHRAARVWGTRRPWTRHGELLRCLPGGGCAIRHEAKNR